MADNDCGKLVEAYYTSTKTTVRARGGDSISFETHSGVRKGCALSPTLFNYIIGWILARLPRGSGGWVAAVCMHTIASETKVMSVLILGEQRQGVLFDREPLEDVDKF